MSTKIPVIDLTKIFGHDISADMLFDQLSEMNESKNENKIREYVLMDNYFEYSTTFTGIHALNHIFQVAIVSGETKRFSMASGANSTSLSHLCKSHDCKNNEVSVPFLVRILKDAGFSAHAEHTAHCIGCLVFWGNHFSSLVHLEGMWREVDSLGYVGKAQTLRECESEIVERGGKIIYIK